MSKLPPTNSKTLKLHMQHVAKKVGASTTRAMGESFGLMLGGWTSGAFHYVVLFGIYAVGGVRLQPILAISPMVHGQSADVHIEFMSSVLGLYGKTIDMVHFIVGGNCSTKQSVAAKLSVPLIDCASHRFNLAVSKYLAEYSDLTDQVHALMVQLHQPNNFVELSLHTHLHPAKADATRWSSAFDMLERYISIREATKRVAAVEDLVPRSAAHKKIVALFQRLTDMNSVCKTFQLEDRTLAEVRLLFDSVVEKYPAMGDYLRPTARIVHSPIFESAVVKPTNNAPLSINEAKSVRAFMDLSLGSSQVDDASDDFATNFAHCQEASTVSASCCCVQ